MLQNIKELYGTKLAASDGDIGQLKDFYFDDKSWTIRYLVADTGTWLSTRQVLFSPHALGHFDRDGRMLSVNLTRKQIENSPLIESHKPVSRQHEVDYNHYYGWPASWDGGAMRALGCYPIVMPPSRNELETQLRGHEHDDTHLRSTKAVTGYAIHATDGAIGSVSGFMVDDQTWTIGELMVEAGHWYSGREILIPTGKISRISYGDSKAFVHLTKADIQLTGESEVAEAGGGNPGAKNHVR
jgi:hypothetical protein